MAIINEAVAGVVESVTGLPAVGVGLATVAAVVVGARAAKPLAKGTLRGYFALTHGTRRWAAEAKEQMQDLYAEAKHEYEASHPDDPNRPVASAPTKLAAG